MTDEEAELFCLTVGANQAKKHLDKHDPNGYNGHCPICSAQLTLWDGILYCSAVPEHFEIKQQTFEAAWDKYDAGVMTLESLFRVLIGGNIAKRRTGC